MLKKLLDTLLSQGFKADQIVEKLQTIPKYKKAISKALAIGYPASSIISSLTKSTDGQYQTAEARGARALKKQTREGVRDLATTVTGLIAATSAGHNLISKAALQKGVDILGPEENEGETIDVTPKPPQPKSPSSLDFQRKGISMQEPVKPQEPQELPPVKPQDTDKLPSIKPQADEEIAIEKPTKDINLAQNFPLVTKFVNNLAASGKSFPYIYALLMNSKKLTPIAKKYEIATGKRIEDYVRGITERYKKTAPLAKKPRVRTSQTLSAGDELMKLMGQQGGNDLFSQMDEFEKLL
jgi:hypothetical protein